MFWKKLVGRGSSEEGEKGYVYVYNGTGAEVAAGSPLCWDAITSDGRTVLGPTQTGFNNMSLFAGINETAIATADYDHITAYGALSARTYGIATTFIPGASLFLVVDKDYLAYGTEGIPNQGGLRQSQTVVALETHSTVSTALTKVFLKGFG